MEATCAGCGKTFDDTGDGLCPHCGARLPPRVGLAPPTVDLPPQDREGAFSVRDGPDTAPDTEVSEIACPGCGQPVPHTGPNERVECLRCGTSFIPSMIASSRQQDGGTPGTLAGYRLGGYSIAERVGFGGFGIVYRATHELMKREAAVKILSPAFARDPDTRERFVREARLASALEHPGIVKVFDAGLDGDVFYIAMEFVRGTDLAELVEEKGRPDPAEAVRIVASTCSALQAAHEAGILHRDIKPENILISGDGEVKLTDFGIARRLQASTVLTRTGGLVGTPGYVAPELVEGKQGDERSDIYSLGATLYFLLTGSHPYAGEHPMMVLFYRRAEQVPPAVDIAPDVPQPLSDIAARMLAKSPAERYPSAEAVARDLRSYLDGDEVKVDLPSREVPKHELPFGVVALRENLVTEDQLLRCIVQQERARARGQTVPPLGEIMVRKGLISPEKIPRVLGLKRVPGRAARAAPEVSVKQEAGCTVVLVSGSCDHDDLVLHLEPVMAGVMRRSTDEVVLDLMGMRSVATDTASEILTWADACKARGKAFRVRCDRKTQERFARLGLVEVAGIDAPLPSGKEELAFLPDGVAGPRPAEHDAGGRDDDDAPLDCAKNGEADKPLDGSDHTDPPHEIEYVEKHAGVYKFFCPCGQRVSIPVGKAASGGGCPGCGASLVFSDSVRITDVGGDDAEADGPTAEV